MDTNQPHGGKVAAMNPFHPAEGSDSSSLELAHILGIGLPFLPSGWSLHRLLVPVLLWIQKKKKDWKQFVLSMYNYAFQDMFIQISGYLKAWFLFFVLSVMVCMSLLQLPGKALFGWKNGDFWLVKVECRGKESSPQVRACSHCGKTTKVKRMLQWGALVSGEDWVMDWNFVKEK